VGRSTGGSFRCRRRMVRGVAPFVRIQDHRRMASCRRHNLRSRWSVSCCNPQPIRKERIRRCAHFSEPPQGHPEHRILFNVATGCLVRARTGTQSRPSFIANSNAASQVSVAVTSGSSRKPSSWRHTKSIGLPMLGIPPANLGSLRINSFTTLRSTSPRLDHHFAQMAIGVFGMCCSMIAAA